MPRFKVSFLAACGLLILAAVLGAIGPKRALAALGFTPVRDVDGPGRQPFATDLVVTGNDGTDFTVPGPGNKRLVITAVSAIAVGTTDRNIRISTVTNGFGTEYFIPYTTRGDASFAILAGEAVAHADPGSRVFVDQFGPDTAQITIHGYLVDVP